MTVLIILCIIVLLGFLFEKKYTPASIKSVGTAYVLWIFSFFGLLGFHRFYIGKYGTGFLWMFTGGVFLIGAFFDLFILSSQVKKHNSFFNLNAFNVNSNQNGYKDSIKQKIKNTNSSVSLKTEQEINNELIQNISKNIKITVTLVISV